MINVIFSLALFVFCSTHAQADECRLDTNGNAVCGGTCTTLSDGQIACTPATGLPGECLYDVQRQRNVCGGACISRANGMVSCSMRMHDECMIQRDLRAVCGGKCTRYYDGSVACTPATGLPGQCLFDGRTGARVCGGACIMQPRDTHVVCS